jgi:hypothetical protein
MSDLDLKWADAVLTALPHLNVAPQPYKATCCCSEPFVIDGVRYESRNAGCPLHGIRSRYVPQPASILKAKRGDAKRHTAVNERD